MRGLVVVFATLVLGAGCIGDPSRYARYQDEKGALRQIDALVATIPQYPGARLAGRQDFSSSYHVSVDRFIDAEPYSSALYYAVSKTVSGATLQRYFRRVLHARGWSCRFTKRSRGVPYGFGCSRRGAGVSADIADHGSYELDIGLATRVPPIHTIPGD